MQKKTIRWIVIGLAIIGLVIILVWATSYTPHMVSRASDNWSRGRIVGETSINRQVAIRPVADGGVFLIWPNLASRLEMAQIGTAGEVLMDRTLSLETEAPRDPQLQVSADGRLHLLWREEEQPHATIRYALLEADGTPVGPTHVLSDPTHWVLDAPRLISSDTGSLYALWADEAGLQWAVLDQTGTVDQEAVLLIPQTRSPVAQMDREGHLHLAWYQRTAAGQIEFYYAVLDPTDGEVSEPEQIGRTSLRIGQRIDSLALGLDQENVLVAWALEDRRAASFDSHYAIFPLGLPQQRQAHALRLAIGQSASGFAPLDGQHPQLVAAVSEAVTVSAQASVLEALLNTGSELDVTLQIAVVNLSEETLVEDIVTASNRALITPALIQDSQNAYHLASLETGGFGLYRVAYASTAPGVTAAYNRITLWDIVNTALSSLWQVSLFVLSGIPMLFLWAVVPMLGLIIYHLITSDEDLDLLRSRLALVGTIGFEIALTILVPLRVEVAWSMFRWVVPIITAALSSLAAWALLRNKEQSRLFLAFFAFTGINCLLLWIAYLIF